MRRIICSLTLLVILLFGVKMVSAQSFNSGIIAGATFCQVDGDHYAGFHQLGFTAGMTICRLRWN